MKARIYTKEIMDQVYVKDSWLYWAVSKPKIQKHNLAGSLDKSTGYYKVTINGNSYKNHRILYQFYHNVILEPDDVIDHINRNKTDNRKENLVKGTKQENCCNRKTPKNNLSTGFKNISIKKDSDMYRLKIVVKKVIYVEYFKLKDFTLEEVIKIRDEKLQELHGEYYSLG